LAGLDSDARDECVKSRIRGERDIKVVASLELIAAKGATGSRARTSWKSWAATVPARGACRERTRLRRTESKNRGKPHGSIRFKPHTC
jgi:hypothetical protein